MYETRGGKTRGGGALIRSRGVGGSVSPVFGMADLEARSDGAEPKAHLGQLDTTKMRKEGGG